MIKTIRFFRLDNDYKAGWYADVPNHTLAENEMVAGGYELWICNVTHDVLLKYAIAYDTAEYSLANGIPTLTVDCKYDRYIGVYDVGIFVFRFHWELLRYIQDRGMIHRCTIIYTQE